MNKIVKIEKPAATPVSFKGAQQLADFDHFDKSTAKLLRLLKRILDAFRDLVGNNMWGLSKSTIATAELLLQECEEDGVKTHCQQLKKTQELLEPTEYWPEESETISAPFVVVMLTKFLCAFPTHNVPDPQAFQRRRKRRISGGLPFWNLLTLLTRLR